LKYRKEIDGLRAIAVVPVILFHAGFEFFSGGFIGVDVFFVISGYLITTIILLEKEKGEFSITDFYERRARRIAPALFFVAFISCIASWLWLPPSHMKDFSQSLVAMSTFSSNILFWLETGYWGVENELKPLLHTWSLAVEEQFYIIFPLLLLVLWKSGKLWILIFLTIFSMASLGFSHWAADKLPSANFFLLPFRAWELAIGAFIAFYFVYRKEKGESRYLNYWLQELLAWFGLLLIFYSIINFNESTLFPSLYTLIPTLGTALVIVFANANTLCSKLLGSKVFVGIGLISYSAYLWHQPLFVFARHKSLSEPSQIQFALLAILSLVLGYFSWKYVEAPFRNRFVFSRKKIFVATFFGLTLFSVLGGIGHMTDGYKSRVDITVATAIESASLNSFDEKLCRNIELPNAKVPYCELVPSTGEYVFLYGDSHANALMSEAKEAFKNTDYGLLFSGRTGCLPVLSLYRADHVNHKECYELNKRIYDEIADIKEIKYVMLAARWTHGLEGKRFDNEEGGVELGSSPHLDLVTDGEYFFHQDYSHRKQLMQAYIESISYFNLIGKEVILVYPVPEAGWNVPDYISKYYWRDPSSVFNLSTASTSHKVFLQRNKRAIDTLDKASISNSTIDIFPESIFCNNALSERCITQKDGVIYYRDNNHLSNSGAKLVLKKVIDAL